MFSQDHSEKDVKVQPRDMHKLSLIFSEHGDFLMSIIRSKFSPRPDIDIEDLFQNLFVSLLEKQIPPDIKCTKSYIYRAIDNDIKDQYRKEKKRKDLRENVHYLYSQKIKRRNVLDEPSNQVEHKDLLCYIERKANRHLPSHQANAIKQSIVKNNFSQKGADNLNVSKRTFSRYLCTGLKKLRDFLPEL